MRNNEDDRKLMALAGQIIAWNKVDANQILATINEFEELLNKHRYQPTDFGITQKTLPSAYIPKALKESKMVLLTDKSKSCIFGDKAPYTVRTVESVKKNLQLIKKLKNLKNT